MYIPNLNFYLKWSIIYSMRTKLRDKRFQVWLDEIETKFINEYAQSNHLTGSELIRGWIHEVMKREGYKIKEPTLPEANFKR